jgi:ATP-grasp domain, R2K clade family 3
MSSGRAERMSTSWLRQPRRRSMKHYRAEAAFIPDVSDEPAAWKVASRFRELREEEFAGGFVLRRFEDFVGAEVRTWPVRGRCELVTAHPGTPDEPEDLDLAPFTRLIASMGSPFITADLVKRADGTWRVVEVGDGQVSDRPPDGAPWQALWHSTNGPSRSPGQPQRPVGVVGSCGGGIVWVVWGRPDLAPAVTSVTDAPISAITASDFVSRPSAAPFRGPRRAPVLALSMNEQC